MESSSSSTTNLDFTATRNEAGDTLVLHVVNYATTARSLQLNLNNFGNISSVSYLSLNGTESASNTPRNPTNIVPREYSTEPGKRIPLKAYSYTVIQIVRENEQTGMNTIPSRKYGNHPDMVYDLSGRKTGNRGNIYIANGKKVMATY